MSLLDDLLNKAAATVDDKAADWLDDLLNKGDELARERLAGPELDVALEALAKLEDGRDDLAHLGRERLAAALAYLGIPAPEKAEALLASTPAELEEQLYAAGDRLYEDRKARDRALAALRELTVDAVRILLPIALAAA